MTLYATLQLHWGPVTKRADPPPVHPGCEAPGVRRVTRDIWTAPVLPQAWLRFSMPGPAARPKGTLVGLRSPHPTAEPGDRTSSQAPSPRSPAGVRLQPAKAAQRPAHLNRWRPRSSLPCLESSRAAETTSQRSRAPDEGAAIETETGSVPSPSVTSGRTSQG